ncbi:MAG: hypothetical protein HF981_11160 [Desulfobacteraceae bacterium]|nr:hypothetical protein [Desulfobacteraceae bacterium]MBC2750933.1 hypothetical protein [Desulfobacteraceae bacterium]
MTEELISQYIDDALDFDDKIVFVERIHDSERYKDDTVELLTQEKALRAAAWDYVPEVVFPQKANKALWMRRPLAVAASALAAAALMFFFFWPPVSIEPPDRKVAHRFVVFEPDVETVAIIGTFNNWQVLPMIKTGREGYWEISLELAPGEHRYSFLLDDSRRMADPTVHIREKDDFGSENSVLEVRT